jgi:hypothetical protein
MTSNDIRLIEAAHKTILPGTLKDYPDLQSAFRNQGYEVRDTAPGWKIQETAHRILVLTR